MPDSPQQPDKPETRESRATGGIMVPARNFGGPALFVPTDEQRAKARQLAKAFPPNGERHIAAIMNIPLRTLQRHLGDDMRLGRAEMLAAVGAQMINRAIDAEATDGMGKKIAKGDLDAQKFVLARFGGWSAKIEHTGEGGGPIRTFDLSTLSETEKLALLPVLDKLIGQAGPVDGEFEEVNDGGDS